MPGLRKVSTGTTITSKYLRSDFVWPTPEVAQEKTLCAINDDEFLEKRMDECRRNRTFYFNDRLCVMLQMRFDQKGHRVSVHKNVVLNIVTKHWDIAQLKRWHNLKEESVNLVNTGKGWWTAETLWIKANL